MDFSLFKKLRHSAFFPILYIAIGLFIYVFVFIFMHGVGAYQMSRGLNYHFVYPVSDLDSSGYTVIADNMLSHHIFSEYLNPPYLPSTFRTPTYPVLLAAWKFLFRSFSFFPVLQIVTA